MNIFYLILNIVIYFIEYDQLFGILINGFIKVN